MHTDNEIKAMISLLDDPDKEIITQVEKSIMDAGETAIPLLEQAWEAMLDPLLNEKIEVLIHKIQFSNIEKKLNQWAKEGGTDLLEGMWLVAKYQYPDLDLQHLRDQIADLFRAFFLEFNNNLTALEQVKVINYVLFQMFKFSGNVANFHNPANSMINKVLETKKGNPISLCVIYLLVAKTMKLPIYGVNLPNLFVLTYKKDDIQFYINVFNKGIVFNKKDIDQYLKELTLSPKPEYYEPCDNINIIQRVLRNLILSFEKLSDKEKVGEISRLLEFLEIKKIE